MQNRTMSRIELKRQEFRQKYQGILFNSYINVVIVLLIFIVSILYSFSKIDWDFLAFLLVPLGFLYGEGIFYLAHRFQQHKKIRFQEAVFEMHTIWHHGMFSSSRIEVESSKDMNMVILPFFIHGAVLGAIYFPVALVIENVSGSDIGWIVMFSVALNLAWYEFIHTLSHLDNPPMFQTLANHHREHHNPRLMGKYNFGIGTTVFDRLCGTRYSVRD